MKPLLFVLSLLFFVKAAALTTDTIPRAKADVWTRHQDIIRLYQRLEKKGDFSSACLHDRLVMLDALGEIAAENALKKNDTTLVLVNEMIMKVLGTTPAPQFILLLDSVGADVYHCDRKFPTLAPEQKVALGNMARWAVDIHENREASSIFRFSETDFRSQLTDHVVDAGDNIFQSHFTDFCGKVALMRLWILYDGQGFFNFMRDLYKDADAEWNGKRYKTPDEVVDAVNLGRVSKDPSQKFHMHGELMPQKMDLVFCLTMASEFHPFLFKFKKYKPEKHLENTAWAGGTVQVQKQMMDAIGFNVRKVGNNFNEVTDAQFRAILDAASGDALPRVLLLVNSSMLDTLTGTSYEDTIRPIEHPGFGTHWIILDKVKLSKSEQGNQPQGCGVFPAEEFTIWEYGQQKRVDGKKICSLQKMIAGALIIDGYSRFSHVRK
jgi:hypothetical protein